MITIQITEQDAQYIAEILPVALKSVNNLSNFEGAMPFGLDEYGVETYKMKWCLEMLKTLTDGKLPEIQDEDLDVSDEENDE